MLHAPAGPSVQHGPAMVWGKREPVLAPLAPGHVATAAVATVPALVDLLAHDEPVDTLGGAHLAQIVRGGHLNVLLERAGGV
jgi:hypothetical protein